MRRKEQQPHNPMDDEVSGGKFVHGTGNNSFRGQPLPSHFEVRVDEEADLEDGQVVGSTRFGQTLYWIYNSIVSKG